MSRRSVRGARGRMQLRGGMLALSLLSVSAARAQTLDQLSAPSPGAPASRAAAPADTAAARPSSAAHLDDIKDGVRVNNVFRQTADAPPPSAAPATAAGPQPEAASAASAGGSTTVQAPPADPPAVEAPRADVATGAPPTSAPSPAPPPAVQAAASMPPVVLNHPDVLDSAKLSANGQTVPLFGIVGLGGEEAQGLKSYIAGSGDRLTCSPQAGEFACLMPDGTDLAMVALVNGAAQSRVDSPDDYREQEAAAQAARRGIWASLPPPPVRVTHPTVRDTATLEADRVTYMLDGVAGVGGAPAQQLQGFIVSQGDTLTCQQQGLTTYYICLLPDGTDLAKSVLVNGAGRVSADATDEYRLQQREAIANKRGIWAVMPPAQIAVYETETVQQPDAVTFVQEVGPASDGINYVGGQPTAVVDGELVFLAFAGAAGWGYYDHFHHWRGAPDRFAHHMERFHPEGRGLHGYGPGGVREAHLRGDEFRRDGLRPASFGHPGEFGREGFGPHPGPGGRPAFERPMGENRPGFAGRPEMGRPGFAARPEMGRPGFAGHPEMGRPGFAARPEMGRPAMAGRPEMARPEMSRPAFGQPQANHFAAAQPGPMMGRPGGPQPGFNRPAPAFGGRPGGAPMPVAHAAPAAAPRPAPAPAPHHK